MACNLVGSFHFYPIFSACSFSFLSLLRVHKLDDLLLNLAVQLAPPVQKVIWFLKVGVVVFGFALFPRSVGSAIRVLTKSCFCWSAVLLVARRSVDCRPRIARRTSLPHRTSKRRLSPIASLSKPLCGSITYPHGEYSVQRTVSFLFLVNRIRLA